MVDTESVVGLAVGYLGGQILGNYVEDQVKPGIVDTATSQDKLIAGGSNDGTKLALAYGAYSIGKSSVFLKNVTWGALLSAIVDAGWRYTHNGVPYGYKPFNIPLLGDLNDMISGPNSGSENIRTMDACSDARAAADRVCAPVSVPVPAPVSTPIPAPTAKVPKDTLPPSDYEAAKRTIEAWKDFIESGKGNKCTKFDSKGRCISTVSYIDTDSVEEILAKGQELLSLPAPPMSPARKQTACNLIKTDAIAKNRPYTAQEMELCTGLLSGYVVPIPGTSPGDITPSPSDNVAAPVQDEDPVSTIPDRQGRFAFMEENNAKHFGFVLGSPISGREKYFGMKT